MLRCLHCSNSFRMPVERMAVTRWQHPGSQMLLLLHLSLSGSGMTYNCVTTS
jgi:hypothetical protein